MKLLSLGVAAALLAGCAGGRVKPGPHKDGYGVEASAATPEAARRKAVEGLLDLFVDPRARPAASETLEAKVLAKPQAYILREKAKIGDGGTTLRAVVSYGKLGRELDGLGLIRPDGVKGKPKIFVSLLETSAAGRNAGEGRASAALRRRLLALGYAVLDMSDALDAGGQKTGAPEEAKAGARKAGAEIVVTGRASVSPVDDARLAGYGNARARLEAKAETLVDGKLLASLEQEATAVDVGLADASTKALDSAGELAADKLQDALASIYKLRAEFTLDVLNLGDLERAKKFLAALRGLPAVSAASLDSVSGSDVKFKLFVERLGADELTAQLLRLEEFKPMIRSVEPAYNQIEISSGDAF